MNQPRIAISAISSFSGLWIAQKLKQKGAAVFGLAARDSSADYSGLARTRIEKAQNDCDLQFGLKSEDGSMANWLRAQKLDVFVFHHHFMENFRSPKYDLARARQIGIESLRELVPAIQASGAKGIIYSGTYFEQLPLTTSPYGFSKHEVWTHLSELCSQLKLPLSKVVMANPIGPLENEDRLIPTLIQKSRAHETFEMGAPLSHTYPIPISVLTDAYQTAVQNLMNGKAEIQAPSLGPMTNRELAESALRELVEKRLGLHACPIRYANQAPPTSQIEHAPANAKCDWPAFWDFYAREL